MVRVMVTRAVKSEPRPETKLTLSPVTEPEQITLLGSSLADVWGALVEVWGPLPVTLGQAQLAELRGMAAAARAGHHPYTQLIGAIERYGRVIVAAE